MPELEPTPSSNLRRRLLEVTLLIAVWMILGFVLHPGPEAYLLIGVPLTVLFQVLVRRQPVRALWVRDAPPFRLSVFGWLIAALLAGLLALDAIAEMADGHGVSALFHGAVALGAVPAVYGFRHLNRAKWRAMVACAVISVVLDCLFRLGLWRLGLGSLPHAVNGQSLSILGSELLIFIPTVCMLEEVSFRGLLDSHLHEDDTQPGNTKRGWASATYLSALWGLWHLPITPGVTGESFVGVVLLLLIAHVPFGIVLSLYWRRTGNLLVPGIAHALLDAIRDAFYM